MSCRTNCCKTFLLVFALLAMAILALPAFGQANNCLKDVSKANSCTANDVSIAAVKNGSVNVFQGGLGGGNSCIAGGQFSFTAEFEVKTTSSSTRSNVGVFFGTGQSNALSGTCTDAILAPAHSCANGTATCGDLNYSEKDGSINGETAPASAGAPAGCGDTASGDSSADFGAGTHAAVLEVDNVTCPAAASTCPAGSGVNGACLVLPVCSSWSQPTNTMPVCTSPGPNYPWQPQAVPGAPSKCVCGVLFVPVTPVTITPVVQKACTTATSTPQTPKFDPGFENNPPTSPTQSPTTCAAGQETNTVTYTVAISNPSNIAGNNAIVDQICDDKYGTVFRSGTFTGPTCPTGSGASNVNCPPSGTTGVAPLATETCTFTASQSENLTVQDTVTAWGHSALSSSSTFGGTTGLASNPVTVTSTDAPTTTTTSKAVEPVPGHACVTVRIDATVTNNSANDETVTLKQVGTAGPPPSADYVSALRDSAFGDITVIHGDANTSGSVTGTTCGIAASNHGSGTTTDLVAADYTDGGAFPKTLDIAGGTHPTYTCKFDGVVCGTAAPISGVCAEGIQVLSTTLTANLVGDDPSPNGDTVGQTQTPIDVDVCLVPSGH